MIYFEETIFDSQENDEICFACKIDLNNSAKYRNFKICAECNFHFHIPAKERINLIIDQGTFKEINKNLSSNFEQIAQEELENYDEKIKSDQFRTGLNEAVVTGTAKINGEDIIIIALDFGFLGGSMGLIVGEKVALAYELASKKNLPAITIINSGGSRIQEGVISLMQMSKTVSSANLLKNSNIPMITILCNPSTGQTMSSFATISDVIIGEPGAKIGYSSYRKLKNKNSHDSRKQYTSEEFLTNGFIDLVVSRDELKYKISVLISILKPKYSYKSKRLKITKNKNIKFNNALESLKISRNIDRPKSSIYINNIFSEFIELHGDRIGNDDNSVIIGIGKIVNEPFVLVAQERRVITKSNNNVSRNYNNKIMPSGFRKANRALKLAEKFKIPCLCLVDAVYPELSLKSEYSGLAYSISELLSNKLSLETPILSIIIGEGGSETALAFSIADSIMMQKNSIFTPLSPEEAAKIRLGDSRKVKEISNMMRFTSEDCLKLGIIDRVIDEPNEGSHQNHLESSKLLQEGIIEELSLIKNVYPKTLAKRRANKFRKMGDYSQKYKTDLKTEINIWSSAFKAGISTFRSNKPLSEEK
ncbi:MAG: carboxyl transferase domain-containing protein [Chloroflexota bacterium]|nr:carboxyl transferase domain-containing protein [Chloroflexota bacterium]